MNLFHGENIRLTASRLSDAAVMASWTEDAGYLRNLDTDYAFPMSADAFEQADADRAARGRPASSMEFRIRPLHSDELLGFVTLHSIEWNNRCGNLAIGIGDPNHRNKGIGTEAVRLILRYAFHELNLHRVGLDVISNNTLAIRAYEKAGFRQEGAQREAVIRDGKVYDRILMGILRSEYEARDEG